MSNAPPQAHPDWMLTATPKGWHYNRTQSGCALALNWALYMFEGKLCGGFCTGFFASSKHN
ncbi:MAG: hypothetical protein ABNH53_14255 [Henriciella sp.]